MSGRGARFWTRIEIDSGRVRADCARVLVSQYDTHLSDGRGRENAHREQEEFELLALVEHVVPNIQQVLLTKGVIIRQLFRCGTLLKTRDQAHR